jgi:signal transduction histidine kinase
MTSVKKASSVDTFDFPFGLKEWLNSQPRRVRLFSQDFRLLWESDSPNTVQYALPYCDAGGNPVDIPPEGTDREDWPVNQVVHTGIDAVKIYDLPPSLSEDGGKLPTRIKVRAWPLELPGRSDKIIVEEIKDIALISGSAPEQSVDSRLDQLDIEVSELLMNVVDFIENESEEDLHRIRLVNPTILPCRQGTICSAPPILKKRRANRGKDASNPSESADSEEITKTFHYCNECEIYLMSCPDPLTRVGENFNRLLSLLQLKFRESIEAHRRLQQTEKVASLGEMMLGVAHEIKNPLSIIIGRLDCLALEIDSLTREELTEDIDVVHQQAARVKGIIDQLLKMAKPSPPRLQSIHISSIVHDVMPVIRRTLEHNQIDLDYISTSNLPEIKADSLEVQQVLLNLVLNARDAMPEGGLLKLETGTDDAKKFVLLKVMDTGVGISPENLDRVFSPFYSTKISGTGLGLAVCRRIMKRQGGKISIESDVGKGTTFTLKFPVNGSI